MFGEAHTGCDPHRLRQVGVCSRSGEHRRGRLPGLSIHRLQLTDQQHCIDPHDRIGVVFGSERLHECHGGLDGFIRRLLVGDIGKQVFPHPLADPLDRAAVGFEGQLRQRDLLEKTSRSLVERSAALHGLPVVPGLRRRLHLGPAREAGVAILAKAIGRGCEHDARGQDSVDATAEVLAGRPLWSEAWSKVWSEVRESHHGGHQPIFWVRKGCHTATRLPPGADRCRPRLLHLRPAT